MKEVWPWLVLAGLGAFHGLNPAMGWLFAVALGLNRESRGAVLMALPPIALGHALAIAVVAVAIVLAGVIVQERLRAVPVGIESGIPMACGKVEAWDVIRSSGECHAQVLLIGFARTCA